MGNRACPGVSRRECERLLPRASNTIRSVGRLFLELVRTGAHVGVLVLNALRFQTEKTGESLQVLKVGGVARPSPWEH